MLKIIVEDTADTRKRWTEPVPRFIADDATIYSDRPIDLKVLAGLMAIMSAKMVAAIRATEG